MRFSLQLAGARALRMTARTVRPDEVGALAPLISAMKRVLAKEKAQGVCAPQLGQSLRLCALHPDGSEEPPQFMLNPRIIRRSRSSIVEWEACLSVPEYAGLVSRAARVCIEYETLDGETVEEELSGNCARVFQHEFDHLNGVLYTSRMIASSFAHKSMLHTPASRDAIEELEAAALEEASAADRIHLCRHDNHDDDLRSM